MRKRKPGIGSVGALLRDRHDMAERLATTEAEVAKLRSVNAKLLTACKRAFATISERFPRDWPGLRSELEAAIEAAEPKESAP